MNESEKMVSISAALDELFAFRGEVTLQTNLIEDLALDSLDIIELQLHLEASTGVTIANDVVTVTVQDLLVAMQ